MSIKDTEISSCLPSQNSKTTVTDQGIESRNILWGEKAELRKQGFCFSPINQTVQIWH